MSDVSHLLAGFDPYEVFDAACQETWLSGMTPGDARVLFDVDWLARRSKPVRLAEARFSDLDASLYDARRPVYSHDSQQVYAQLREARQEQMDVLTEVKSRIAPVVSHFVGQQAELRHARLDDIAANLHEMDADALADAIAPLRLGAIEDVLCRHPRIRHETEALQRSQRAVHALQDNCDSAPLPTERNHTRKYVDAVKTLHDSEQALAEQRQSYYALRLNTHDALCKARAPEIEELATLDDRLATLRSTRAISVNQTGVPAPDLG